MIATGWSEFAVDEPVQTHHYVIDWLNLTVLAAVVAIVIVLVMRWRRRRAGLRNDRTEAP